MKGVYTLIILWKANGHLEMPSLGCFDLQKGYYAYTGSAMGDGATSLGKRIVRHLKKRKTRHWHIDFLLANKNATITALVAAQSSVNIECRVNSTIKNMGGATLPIPGFGASDCRQKCKSHLVYFDEENTQEKIFNAYTSLFGQDSVLNVTVCKRT